MHIFSIKIIQLKKIFGKKHQKKIIFSVKTMQKHKA